MINLHSNILICREGIVIFLLHFMWFYITRSAYSYTFHITANWNLNQIVFYMYLFFMITIEETSKKPQYQLAEHGNGVWMCYIRVQLINKKFHWIHPSWNKFIRRVFLCPLPHKASLYLLYNLQCSTPSSMTLYITQTNDDVKKLISTHAHFTVFHPLHTPHHHYT